MRMMDRIAEGDKLQDHELLEIILFNPIPRKNTNEIAHRLLTAFGSLKNVFSAEEEELVKIEGVGRSTAAYLKSVAELVRRVSSAQSPLPKAYSFGEFSSFVGERFAGLTEEYIDVYCLDGRDHITHTSRFTSNEVARASLSTDDVNRLFLSRAPYGIVVAHNHPSAPCRPSAQDDSFTAQLQILCSLNKVKLRDHIIVGADGMYSYFTQGRLEEIENTYSVENIIGKKHIP